jgi:hypothetical protein
MAERQECLSPDLVPSLLHFQVREMVVNQTNLFAGCWSCRVRGHKCRPLRDSIFLANFSALFPSKAQASALFGAGLDQPLGQ